MPAVDVLVIGGGIHGVALARDAALRGLSVTLVEQGDLASGTSSRSSKLVHGGLRYLETGQFGLVREALAERRTLLATAPDFVRPLPFLLPADEGGRPTWQVEIGLLLYDRLTRKGPLPRHRRLSNEEACALEPTLPLAGHAGAARYFDACMDDAGLVVANAVAAARAGARIATRTRVEALVPGWRATVRHADGARETIEARVVVNAAGPWIDALRATAGALPAGAPSLRPTRGTHIVVPAITREHALLLFARLDRRVFFVVPEGEHSLVGTTDVDDLAGPDHVAPTAEDVRYLLDELAGRWPQHSAAHDPLHATSRAFAGLRPLARGNPARPWDNRREARLVVENGMYSMVGGKFTTARLYAERVVDRVVDDLGRRAAPCATRVAILPGPSDPELAAARARWWERDPASAPGGLAPARADVEVAIEHLFARRVADVVWRRGQLWLDGVQAAAAAHLVGQWMAERLGWSATECTAQVDEVTRQVDGEARVIAEAVEGRRKGQA